MKEKLTSNIGLKLLSLFLATFLWLAVVNSQDPIETVTFTDVPVTIINEDALTEKDKIPEVVEGDKIVTSNISDKYLPGILIGYISTINRDANNLTKSGYITPAVDFEHLEEVLVILEQKQTIEE